ncbi:MAG: hypothetical protein Tsb0013_23020 [Phycisphaerales bacterium]
MTREQDESYADTLIRMAKTDAESALSNGSDEATTARRRALALWMAEELQREAARLKVSEQTACAMREAASSIRYRVTTALPRA